MEQNPNQTPAAPQPQTQAPTPANSGTPAAVPSFDRGGPGSAADRAAAAYDDAKVNPPKKLTWDELDAIASGRTAPEAPAQNTGTGGQGTVDGGRQNPTGTTATTEPTSQQPQPQAATQQPPAAGQPQQQQAGAIDPKLMNDVIQHLLSQQKPQQQQQTQPPKDTMPEYRYNFPQDVMKGFGSQDPNEVHAALQTYTHLVAREIHSRIRDEFNQSFQRMAAYMPQMIKQHYEQQTQQQQIRNDLYGTYKDLDRPELQDLVLKVALGVAQRDGHQAWNPTLRDTVAREVYGILGRPTGQGTQPQPQAQTQLVPAQQKQPAMMGGSGARPTMEATNPKAKLTNEILDVLGTRV